MKTLKDITPEEAKWACWPLPGCPAIFDDEDGHYVIVGELEDAEKLGIESRVSKGEVVVKIPKHIVDNRQGQ